MNTNERPTEHDRAPQPVDGSVTAFDVRVVSGKDQGARVSSSAGRLTIGTADGNQLKLTDPAVSRFHLEFEGNADSIVARDLGSTNGTWYRRAQIKEIQVQETTEFDLGRSTRIQLVVSLRREAQTLSPRDHFYGLVGSSPAMRMVFSVLERVAPTDASVLLLGESGTGKELAARALHAASKRAASAFEALNCGALNVGTEVSELFGHIKGSFTGATHDRKGIFELASGGTLFLDEIGELSLESQKLLLRALEERVIRRLGDAHDRKVDVRVIAATNRDLRREVNAGRFREDLYYRLAMIQVRMPPLRDRVADLPLLVPHLLNRLRNEVGTDSEAGVTPAMMQLMEKHPWPGNVRELRNYLGQVAVLADQAPILGSENSPAGVDRVLSDDLFRMPLKKAREVLSDRFEHRYISELIERHDTLREAAEEADIDRVTLYRITNRLGLRTKE